MESELVQDQDPTPTRHHSLQGTPVREKTLKPNSVAYPFVQVTKTLDSKDFSLKNCSIFKLHIQEHF